jgi:hypothetical protein
LLTALAYGASAGGKRKCPPHNDMAERLRMGRIFAKRKKFCTGQKKAEQKPFTTEALRHGVFTLFSSVTSRLCSSKNVQPIADYYKKKKIRVHCTF